MELTEEACIRPSQQEAIHAQLARLRISKTFERCDRLRELLDFLVDARLRGEKLTEAQIAQAVLGKGPDFDALIDPAVRVYAGRLRRRLEEYYAADGQEDSIRFAIAPGSYRINIRRDPGQACELFQVAILPCANLTGSPDGELTCRCLDEELLGAISGMYGVEVYWRGFGTKPFSAFDAIVDGSLRCDADRLRLSVRVLQDGGRVAASFSEDYALDAGLDQQTAVGMRVAEMIERLRASAA
jgi:hypothetical protein